MAPPVNILVVDDRAENRLALKAVLDSADYNIIEAANGPDALRALLSGEFAVLLLDVRMPGMDGFEVAAVVHARPKTRALPIVFLTAEATESPSMFKGYAHGAVDYLIKPLIPEVVRAKVAVFTELFRARKQIEAQSKLLVDAERSEAENRILRLKLEGERRYHNLAEAVPHIVWTAAANGAITYLNRRWFEVSGQEHAQDWFGPMHPRDIARVKELWSAALASGKECEFECRLRNARTGAYRWYLGRALPEHDEAGAVVSWLGTFTDIEHQ